MRKVTVSRDTHGNPACGGTPGFQGAMKQEVFVQVAKVARSERRFRAQRIAEQRFQAYLDVNQSWFDRKRARGEAVNHPPVGTYRKRTTWGCPCTKHRHGSPHYGWGACYWGQGVRPTVKARHEVMGIIEEWLAG